MQTNDYSAALMTQRARATVDTQLWLFGETPIQHRMEPDINKERWKWQEFPLARSALTVAID